jgi:hypothetical protein
MIRVHSDRRSNYGFPSSYFYNRRHCSLFALESPSLKMISRVGSHQKELEMATHEWRFSACTHFLLLRDSSIRLLCFVTLEVFIRPSISFHSDHIDCYPDCMLCQLQLESKLYIRLPIHIRHAHYPSIPERKQASKFLFRRSLPRVIQPVVTLYRSSAS